jgi:hypothetical protein
VPKYIIAIDPGNINTALVVYDCVTKRPIFTQKAPNADILQLLPSKVTDYADSQVCIEMVASYGMPVGRTVFDTCVWIGRYIQHIALQHTARLIVRKDVKMHICGSTRATDAHIRQALIDRYGFSVSAAVGTKKDPGPLYKLGNDERAALALAITAAETTSEYKTGE